MAVTLEQFMAATRAQESGGNYKAPPNASGASGAYQFVPGTWAGYGGYAAAYLAPPDVQDAKARQLMQSYYDQFGSWEAVAKSWYAGPGFASKNQTATQKGGAPSINQYASEVMSRLGQRVQTASAGGATVVATRPTDKAGIRSLQEQMKAAGFDPGPIDGLWGPRTQAAYDAYNARPGAAAAPASSSTPTGPALGEKITALALTQHGGVLAPYVNDPDIRALLGRFVKGEIDEATLTGLVMQTNLWKTTDVAARAWQTLETSDPGEAGRRLQGESARLIGAANALGLPLGQDRADILAKQSLTRGWNEAQVRQALVAEVDFAKQIGAATPVGASIEELKQIANDYAVWVPDDQLASWARAIADGGQTLDAFKMTWSGVAKSFYQNPALDSAIASGLTARDYAMQFMGRGADLLEQNVQGLNIMDPKWNRFLQVNPETGQPWSITDATRTWRTETQYGFDDTSRAVAEKREVGMGALQAWGLA